ncbi:hypothetical protein [Konateibacter massiliensis]|uniref:hypothetical protein n=1 Tax=Konateibacter massiliensis TaxID=2002841 RepID=UPI000C152F8A|nr:hypothetical protein [Konateibacter massiliensis]
MTIKTTSCTDLGNHNTTGHNTKTSTTIYSGEINIEDFNTSFPNKKRISNQIDANKLENLLQEKKKHKDEENKYMHMTLEELREMKIVSNTNGRPLPNLTDEKWQKEFNVRKLFMSPYGKDVKKLGNKYSKESGKWNEETQGEYNGCTNWQEYCSYINDILSCIRSGQRDYCYYIYQIMDLAKFHFNNRELKTKYCDGYWEVWLS